MPVSIQFFGLEVSLVNAMSRETILRQYLDTVRKQYTHILICQGAAADQPQVPNRRHPPDHGGQLDEREISAPIAEKPQSASPEMCGQDVSFTALIKPRKQCLFGYHRRMRLPNSGSTRKPGTLTGLPGPNGGCSIKPLLLRDGSLEKRSPKGEAITAAIRKITQRVAPPTRAERGPIRDFTAFAAAAAAFRERPAAALGSCGDMLEFGVLNFLRFIAAEII